MNNTFGYAIEALSYLGEVGEKVSIGKIAEERGISDRFLVQVLLKLKSLGYVESVRGRKGGYRLSAPLDEIHVLRLFETFHADDFSRFYSGKNKQKNPVLEALEERVRNAFDVSLAGLVVSASDKKEQTEVI